MDFRQLRYFMAVAETLSFSRAAQRLHISQPPLSQQIKLLEEDLGVILFARTRRSVALTHAGRLFMAQASRILEQYQTARELCAMSAEGIVGRLRLAFTASVPVFEGFPRILQGFRQAYPRIELDLQHLSTGEQLQALADGRIDVGFLRPSPDFQTPQGLLVDDLWQDELVVAMAASHPMAGTPEPLALAALAGQPFVLQPQSSGCGLSGHIAMLTARAGFAPNIVQQARETSTMLALVAADLGISIVPDTYVDVKPPGVAFRRLGDAGRGSRIVIARSAGDTGPSLSRFLAHAMAQTATRDAPALTA